MGIISEKQRQLLTVSDVAALLQLADRTVLRMVHKGEIPCLRIASQWRFIPEQIEEWLAKGASVSDPDSEGISSLIVTDPGSVPLSRLTKEDYILPDLKPGSREEVLKQLIAPLSITGVIKDPDSYLKRLIAREEMVSTAVGKGIALPHIRNPKENSVERPILVVGICRNGTTYGAPDGVPTTLFFLLLAENEVIHLRLLAEINRFLLRPAVADGLRRAASANQVIEVLLKNDTIYRRRCLRRSNIMSLDSIIDPACVDTKVEGARKEDVLKHIAGLAKKEWSS